MQEHPLKSTPTSVSTASSDTLEAAPRLPLAKRIGQSLENEAVLGYVLMVPALLLIVVFIAYPFSLGVWMSLTDKVVGTRATSSPSHFGKLLKSESSTRRPGTPSFHHRRHGHQGGCSACGSPSC